MAFFRPDSGISSGSKSSSPEPADYLVAPEVEVKTTESNRKKKKRLFQGFCFLSAGPLSNVTHYTHP